MLIVGESLRKLITEEQVLPVCCYDKTCVKLSLGSTIKRLVPTIAHPVLEYGNSIPGECIHLIDISECGLELMPHSSVLAMSDETIQMPTNCFGLLQTKGSLARMLVSIHYSDGQIDPGFCGHITFEIFNGSDFIIKIPCKMYVGNVYIFEVNGICQGYDGKYARRNEPTTFIR